MSILVSLRHERKLPISEVGSTFKHVELLHMSVDVERGRFPDSPLSLSMYIYICVYSYGCSIFKSSFGFRVWGVPSPTRGCCLPAQPTQSSLGYQKTCFLSSFFPCFAFLIPRGCVDSTRRLALHRQKQILSFERGSSDADSRGCILTCKRENCKEKTEVVENGSAAAGAMKGTGSAE